MWSLDTFYRSKEWQWLRELLIDERRADDGILYCQHCGEPITEKYDIIAHHIKELDILNVNDRSISLNPDNILLVHASCHNEIHARFGHEMARKVFIVYGAPLSGKTSYVKSIARPTDLIVDVDSIWQMITCNERYIKPPRLTSNVFAIRDHLYQQVEDRLGKWTTAYIIAGLPNARDREELSTRFAAELIYVDTPEEVCLERLRLCEDARDKAAWAGYIRDWFEEYAA